MFEVRLVEGDHRYPRDAPDRRFDREPHRHRYRLPSARAIADHRQFRVRRKGDVLVISSANEARVNDRESIPSADRGLVSVCDLEAAARSAGHGWRQS